MTSIAHQTCILSQNTPRDRHTRRLPLLQPRINLLGTNIHINAILLRICFTLASSHPRHPHNTLTNSNHIPIPHHRNRPSYRGLRTHMSHDKPVTRARIPSVGDERNVGKFRAHDGRAGFELFGHAWAAFGAFVADYHDDVFAVRDEAFVECCVEFVFFVEDLLGVS